MLKIKINIYNFVRLSCEYETGTDRFPWRSAGIDRHGTKPYKGLAKTHTAFRHYY